MTDTIPCQVTYTYKPGTYTELAEYAAHLAYLRLEGVSRD